MKRTSILTLILVAILSTAAAAQDYRARFRAIAPDDFAAQEKLLVQWEKSRPNDPELFVSYFNFYFFKSRNAVLSLSSERPGGSSVKVTKEDEPNTVAYLGESVSFDRKLFDKGIEWADKGIAMFPDRLDIRFGKTYVLGQINDDERFVAEIVKVVERSAVNKNAWLWLDDKKVDDPERFMLASIQDYVVQLFDRDKPESKKIRTIAESVIKYYPNSVENLSNLGVSFLLENNYKDALVPFLKAEKVSPTDAVVLSNIAFCYLNLSDKANARKYYELVLAYGDAAQKGNALAKLKEIGAK